MCTYDEDFGLVADSRQTGCTQCRYQYGDGFPYPYHPYQACAWVANQLGAQDVPASCYVYGLGVSNMRSCVAVERC